MNSDGQRNFLKTEWRKLLLLLGMCLLYSFSYFQRVAVPGTCFDELQRDFKASAAAITALGSIFLYIYGFGQFFIGACADRFGGQRTMLAGAVILAGASILFPLCRSLSMLYFTRAILAVGASTIFLSLVKEIDTLLGPRHFAIWFGVSLMIGYSGGVVGTYPFERAISHYGWRTALLGAGVLTCLALIITAAVFCKFRVSRPQSVLLTAAHLGSVLRNRLSYRPAAVGAINFSIYFLFQSAIGKKMLADCCGISSARAASITFLMMMVCASASLLPGFISRLIGNRRKPLVLMGAFWTLSATVLLTIITNGRTDYRLLGAGFVMLALGASHTTVNLSSVKEVNISSAAATAIGLANCASYVIVAVITNLAGLIMDSFKGQAIVTLQGIVYPAIAYRMILAGCLVMAVIGATTAFFVRETKGAYSSG